MTLSRSVRIAAGALSLLTIAVTQPWQLLAQAPEPAKGVKYSTISPTEMKEWLTYLASDELQGRQVFTEGYGLAAQYVADRLKEWGVKPIGEDGTYFQPVRLRGYKVTRNSSVTVEVGGQSKTFKHGDHVTFGVNAGGKQTLSFTGAEFVGYAAATDLQARDLKGKLVVALPAAAGGFGRGGGRGVAQAINVFGAKAAISYAAAPAAPSAAELAIANAQTALAQANQALTQAQLELLATQRGAGRGAAFAGGVGAAFGRAQATVPPDLTTPQNVNAINPPQFTGDDTFFEFLFSEAPMKFADLKARSEKGEPLMPFAIPGVKITVNVDNTYELLSMQVSKNVVGMVEGTDPKLKDTYVMFGAHLDHIGYRTTALGRGAGGGCRRTIDPAPPSGARGAQAAAPTTGPAGTPTPPSLSLEQQDLINNGADDDGSGSTAELAIAKAFATGPKPKRSLVFVWHTGEEAGLYGSRYNADFPVVPLEKVQAQLNMDMIGRDDCDDRNGDYTNSVFIVGADRISTDLHNLIEDTNTAMSKPLKLDYEMNDPRDPESVYTRSDHYSYAAKGIPIAFFTTGLHPDYHRVSDTVDKIQFPKMARIAQLVYETGFSLANTDRVLERDNKGPQAGKGFVGKIKK